MISRFSYGHVIETEAILQKPAADNGALPLLSVDEASLSFTYSMADDDKVYGLGENVRGINKRGWIYQSKCSDEPEHLEDRRSLYGAHNFFVVSGKETFGIFIDYPGILTFDIGYTRYSELKITASDWNLDVYVITGTDVKDIVHQFRQLIGRSFVVPKWAFGYGQSRWSYMSEDEIRDVVKKHRELQIPLDSVYLDIDYMERYKDFTLNNETFPDFADFNKEMKDEHIHLVPIIDAGVKEEAGYSVCDEGKEKGYFCKRADGTDFEGTVWPGWSHFPDVLNPEARAWFGSQYKALTDCGIEGFWNDMNEPAIFYSREGLAERLNHPPVPHEDGTIDQFGQAIGWLNLSNAPEDYARFYHKVDGKMVRHDQVHNLYGYNMTRAASEGLASIAPGKRFLLFSRSSCIGMHRYGGVWTGDNHSWWSHLLLNLKMLPSLNMCGFLYVGADLGGFNADTSRDLLLRWLALGVFTPLMRNHSGCDTRRQEFYQFEGPEDFRSVIETRYRLIPYLYSEYMKAALNGDMLFKPLAFVYPEDEIALQTEDQLMLGNEVMIAPVYTQNATGRMVYLPEEMLFVKFGPEGCITQEVLPAGTHFVKVALNEVPLFIRKGTCIPVADPAQTVAGIDPATIRMIGWPGASYDRYDDDGVTIPAE